MEYFYLYLIGQDIQGSLGFIVLIGFIALGFCSIAAVTEDKPLPTRWIISWIILCIVTMLIPSKDSLTYMGAYYVGKQVVQSETSEKLLKVLNTRLDEEISNLTNK